MEATDLQLEGGDVVNGVVKRVEDMIEELQKLPPEAPIFLGYNDTPVLHYTGGAVLIGREL